jgi:hypothetical protein
MSGVLEIDNKKMHTIKSAVSLTSYSRDYITRLAREQKIVASQIGRQWYIDVDSLKNYETLSALEHKIRQQHLSVKRKEERASRELDEAKQSTKQKISQSHSRKAKVLVLGAVFCGVGVGAALNQVALSLPSLDQQVAKAPLMQQMQGYNSVTGQSSAISLSETISISGAHQLDFAESSVSLRTLANAEAGILLLPAVATTSDLVPSEFFSDEVTVVTDESGRQSFRRIDNESGESRELSFVMVPVDPPKTP